MEDVFSMSPAEGSPDAWEMMGICESDWYSVGWCLWRCCAAANPSTKVDSPPEALGVRTWKSWSPHGSVKYVLSVWAGRARLVYAVSIGLGSEVKSQKLP